MHRQLDGSREDGGFVAIGGQTLRTGAAVRGASALEGVAWFVGALLWRLPGLGRRPLWIDERFSVDWSRLPLAHTIGVARHLEPTPPAYYVLLHAAAAILGTGAAAVRFPSAVCSALTVAVAFALGRRLLGSNGGRIAAALLLLDPTSLFYAQEARGYALLGLAQAFLLLLLAIALDERVPATFHPGDDVHGSRAAHRRDAALFAAGATAAATVAVHYTAVAFAAAAALATVPMFIRAGRPLRVLAGAAILALALAWLPLHDALTFSDTANIGWIPPTGLGTVRSFGFQLLLYPGFGPPRLLDASALLLLAIVAAGFIAARPRGLLLVLAVAIPALDLALLIGLSIRTPILLPRIGVGLLLPLCLLLAHAGRALGRAAGPAAIALAALVFIGADADYARHYVKQDWPAAARIVATVPACDGPVVSFGPFAQDLLAYAPVLRRRVLVDILPRAMFRGSAEAALERIVVPATATLPVRALAPFLASHPGSALVSIDFFHAAVARALGPMPSFRVRRPLPGGVEVDCR